MVRGRKPIHTRQQILDHLDNLMVEKGLDNEEPPKGGLLFSWYMRFPSNQRPSVKGLADMYKMNANRMGLFIERWDRNEPNIL